jgi:hypothetical protein
MICRSGEKEVRMPHTYHLMQNANEPGGFRSDIETRLGVVAGISIREINFDIGKTRAYVRVDYDEFDFATVKRVTDALDPIETRILLDEQETDEVRSI